MKLIGMDQETQVGGHHGPEWIDVDRDDPGARQFVDARCKLSDSTWELLSEQSVRNRRVAVPEGLVLRLGFRTTEEDEKASAVGFGLLLTSDRILTVRRGSVREVEALWRFLLTDSEDVTRPWGVLALLVERIAGCVEANLDRVVDTVDDLEDEVFADGKNLPIDELGRLRRHLLRDRRSVTALSRVIEETIEDRSLHIAKVSGEELTGAAQAMLRQERTLTFFLERANLLQDQIQSQLTQRMNQATLRLGVVATVFLPLGFLTGLLGINVAGIPGDHDPSAFWMVCGLLVIVATVVWLTVWRMHRT